MRITPRIVFAAIVVAVAGLIGTAIFYFQDQLGLEPCPMCILSRFCFIAIAIVALVGAIHGPKNLALKIYGGLMALFAVAGVGISLRHSWLQHFPPKVESCGSDLEFLLNTMPLTQVLPKVFAGTGSCSAIDWKFVGLTIPEWAGVWFVIFGAAALWVAWRKPQ
jgi:disulfide bond formation protein DsbB